MKRRAIYTISAGYLLMMTGVVALIMSSRGSAAGNRISPALSTIVSSAAPARPQSPDERIVSGTPTNIEIAALGINLEIIPGYYYPGSKTWSLSLDKAQYAVVTAPANNKSGLTFIYAHNRKGVFQALTKITTGTTAKITTNNGHVFTYAFRSSIETKPSDTSLFRYSGKAIMVAQTCSGDWYQNRQLFIFDLLGVD